MKMHVTTLFRVNKVQSVELSLAKRNDGVSNSTSYGYSYDYSYKCTATRALALVGDRLLKNCIRSEDNRSTKKTRRSSFDEPVEAESKLSQRNVFDSRV